MRRALPIVVATLLIATAIDVVAAGVKTATVRGHSYFLPPGAGVSVALPHTIKGFSSELLSQVNRVTWSNCS